MSKLNRKNRVGRVAEIARLDFHDFWGRLIDRVRGKVTEKDKGLAMVERIESRFGLTEMDKIRFRQRMIEMNDESLQPTKYPKDFKPEKINWTKDSKGRIVSPFGKMKDL